MNKRIYDIREKYNIFREYTDKSELAHLIRDILHGNTKNMVTLEDNPAQLVVDVFNVYENIRDEIKISLSYLICNFIIEFDDKRYLQHLLYLLGRFEVSDDKSLMIRTNWLIEERDSFIGRYASFYLEQSYEDIQQLILRSLIPSAYTYMGYKNPIRDCVIRVCIDSMSEKGIKDNPKHFAICYQLLDKIDYKYTIDYFDALVNICLRMNYELIDIFSPCVHKEDVIDYILSNTGKLKGRYGIIVISTFLQLEYISRQNVLRILRIFKENMLLELMYSPDRLVEAFVASLFETSDLNHDLLLSSASLFLYQKTPDKDNGDDLLVEFEGSLNQYLLKHFELSKSKHGIIVAI